MSREAFIKEAADKYIDMCSTGTYCSADPKEAFIEGAVFADAHPHPGLVDLSKVWHNASIEPERDAFFIAEDNKCGLDAYCWTQRDDDWIEYACLFGLRRWAYMKDLLPKGGALS